MLQGPATFVMAIMGCGEAEAQCQTVAIQPARYESQAACLAASQDALAGADDGAFPVVVAECRRADGSPARIVASEISLPRGGVVGRVQSASARR